MSEKKSEYNKTYYEKNKELWKTKYHNIKILCPVCNIEIKRDHYNSQHVKTKRHTRILELQEQKKAEREKLKQEILEEIKQSQALSQI